MFQPAMFEYPRVFPKDSEYRVRASLMVYHHVSIKIAIWGIYLNDSDTPTYNID
jgi:hypothetical protein